MIKNRISIVVPVYNVAEYLAQCIDSIVHQTYGNLEIILVDDGSTDESGKICDAYAMDDNRIIVIHKENGGLVSARKTGLQYATGEYAAFVDGDDWIESEMYERMLTEMKNNEVDVITCGAYKEFEGSSSIVVDNLPEDIYCNETQELCENLIFYKTIQDHGVMPSIWSKVFKLSLLKRFYLCIDEKICYGEDAACVYTVIPYANSIQIMHEPYYHYRFRSNSIVHQNNSRILEQVGLLYNHMRNQLQFHRYYIYLCKQIEAFITLNIFRSINYFMGFSDETKIPLYVLPSNLNKFGRKIVLYGAGMVGQAYEKQIRCSGELKLVLWVDKMAAHYQTQGKKVNTISKILECDYDVILLAVTEVDMANSVKEMLSNMGIPDDKIFWEKPILILEKYIML